MNVEKWNYMNYSSDNYGSHSQAIELGNLTIYFSYDTVVAFSEPGNLTCTENTWGPTTGKHLNAIQPDHDKRLKRDDFEKQLEKCLKRHKLSV